MWLCRFKSRVGRLGQSWIKLDLWERIPCCLIASEGWRTKVNGDEKRVFPNRGRRQSRSLQIPPSLSLPLLLSFFFLSSDWVLPALVPLFFSWQSNKPLHIPAALGRSWCYSREPLGEKAVLSTTMTLPALPLEGDAEESRLLRSHVWAGEALPRQIFPENGFVRYNDTTCEKVWPESKQPSQLIGVLVRLHCVWESALWIDLQINAAFPK